MSPAELVEPGYTPGRADRAGRHLPAHAIPRQNFAPTSREIHRQNHAALPRLKSRGQMLRTSARACATVSLSCAKQDQTRYETSKSFDPRNAARL